LEARAAVARGDDTSRPERQSAHLLLPGKERLDLAPTKTLSAAMQANGKPYVAKIYPPYGKSHQDGHTFGYFGSPVWENDLFQFLELQCGMKTAGRAP